MLGLTPRCVVSRKCVELFHAYKGDELHLKLAEHTVDGWLYLYKPKFFEAPLPNIFLQYQELKSERERIAFNKDNPDWINGKEMQEYASQKRKFENENKSNRSYLEETLCVLEQAKDAARAKAIRNLLSEYAYVESRVGLREAQPEGVQGGS